MKQTVAAVGGTQEAAIEAQMLQEAAVPLPSGSKVGEGSSHDVTDLILVIHGIGQGVSSVLD